MPVSEARIRANRENSLRSTGPRTPTGLANSRRNAISHGMTCSTLTPECDAPEIERRIAALMAELNPRTAVGKILVGEMATLSHRMELGATLELAAAASRVRNAVRNFDHEREDRAEDLFDAIADDPRKHVRLLKRMPEGVDRLVEGWEQLRDHLNRPHGMSWDPSDFAMAVAMLGHRPEQAATTRLERLVRLARGGSSPADLAWAEVDREASKDWGRGRLAELIDRQVAMLKEHRATLDLEAIEEDRIESPDRVLFDFSRDGYRAMRYQSEARRMFFKALKDFRIAEAEAEAAVVAQPEAAPASKPAPEPAPPLASFREKPAPAAREPEPAPSDPIFPPTERPDGRPRGLDGRVVAVGRAALVPG